jgi:hypothetical protein
MTEDDLALLTVSENKRVELTYVDGGTVIGEVAWVTADDVILDAVLQPDGTLSYVSALSVKFSEIAAVRVVNE